MVSAYSIGKSQRSQSVQDPNRAPGPGQYKPVIEPLSNKTRSPKWTIQGAKRQASQFQQQTPSPGTYNIPEKITKEGPLYSFGVKTEGMFGKDNQQPGPGQYNPNDSVQHQKSPRAILTGKMNDTFHSGRQSPGPGTYSVGFPFSQRGAVKIGNEARDSFYKQFHSNFPGPGAYDQRSFMKETPQYGFGTEKRQGPISKTLVSDLKNLGPGSYNLPSMIRTDLGFKLVPQKTQTAELRLRSQSPGPGAYETSVNLTRQNSPSYRIGSVKRDFSSGMDSKPGPGQYEPKFEQSIQKSPSYRIGSQERQSLIQNHQVQIPGPGNYSVDYKDRGPMFSMGMKRKDRKPEISPGPQKYNLKSYMFDDSKNVKFGSSHREGFGTDNKVPGPGFYDIDKKHIFPNVKFGQEARDVFGKGTPSPGPGHYKLKPMFADVPSYLLQK